MTKDIIKRSLELVKTDKMSHTEKVLYDVGTFLNFLFGTIIRAKYRAIWNKVSDTYTIIIISSRTDVTFSPKFFRVVDGYLKQCWINEFVEELDKIFDDEDREDIEILLPLARRYYQVWLDNTTVISGMTVSDPEIIPYLMRREDKILYSIKTCLML